MIIGITGNIGSGKSYISDIFRKYNVPVYDTDKKSKEIVNSNLQIRKELVELFGNSIFIDGILNKKMLSYYLFSDKGYSEKINSIIHPYVTKDFIEWADKQLETYSIVAVESAILIDTELVNHVNKIIFVDAPLEIRIERVMERDKCDELSVIDRINKQPTNIQYQQKSDYIIVNDGINDIEIIIKNKLDILNKKICKYRK